MVKGALSSECMRRVREQRFYSLHFDYNYKKKLFFFFVFLLTINEILGHTKNFLLYFLLPTNDQNIHRKEFLKVTLVIRDSFYTVSLFLVFFTLFFFVRCFRYRWNVLVCGCSIPFVPLRPLSSHLGGHSTR